MIGPRWRWFRNHRLNSSWYVRRRIAAGTLGGRGGLFVWLALVVVATALTAATYGLGLAGVVLAWAVFFACDQRTPRWFVGLTVTAGSWATYDVLGAEGCIVLTAWFLALQAHLIRKL